MLISDLFCSRTKPIMFQKDPDCEICKNGGYSYLTTPPTFIEPTDGKWTKEMLDAYHAFYDKHHIGLLSGNATLTHYLLFIDEYFNGTYGKYIPIELYDLTCIGSEGVNARYINRMVREIYGTYLCFRFLVWDDPKAYSLLIQRIITPFNQKKDPPYQVLISETPQETCWAYLQRSARNFLNDSSSAITSSICISQGKVTEYVVARDLASALLYQLFLHLAAGKDGIKGFRLAECELCHDTIIKHHGNQRFCEKCAKNDVRVASHRSRKKGEKNNAPHP